jgi:hypothetical protein
VALTIVRAGIHEPVARIRPGIEECGRGDIEVPSGDGLRLGEAGGGIRAAALGPQKGDDLPALIGRQVEPLHGGTGKAARDGAIERPVAGAVPQRFSDQRRPGAAARVASMARGAAALERPGSRRYIGRGCIGVDDAAIGIAGSPERLEPEARGRAEHPRQIRPAQGRDFSRGFERDHMGPPADARVCHDEPGEQQSTAKEESAHESDSTTAARFRWAGTLILWALLCESCFSG